MFVIARFVGGISTSGVRNRKRNSKLHVNSCPLNLLNFYYILPPLYWTQTLCEVCLYCIRKPYRDNGNVFGKHTFLLFLQSHSDCRLGNSVILAMSFPYWCTATLRPEFLCTSLLHRKYTSKRGKNTRK